MVFAIFLLLINSAFAFNYYAPIEPDNKLIVYGEYKEIACPTEICEYRFSITNNDNKAHTVNIFSYLDTDLKQTPKLVEIELLTNTNI